MHQNHHPTHDENIDMDLTTAWTDPEFRDKYLHCLTNTLEQLQETHTPLVTIVALDDSIHNWRKPISSTYKSNRQHDSVITEIFIHSIAHLKTLPFLHILFINQAEADDIIHICVHELCRSGGDYYQITKISARKPSTYLLQSYPSLIIPVNSLNKHFKYAYSSTLIENENVPTVFGKTAILTKLEMPPHIVILTNDKDFLPLLQYANVTIFNLQQKQLTLEALDELTPLEFLQTKIIMGDKSDNIPPITTPCGWKTAVQLAKHPVLLQNLLDSNPAIQLRYQENQQLIDNTRIPEDIKAQIVMAFKPFGL